MLPIISIYLNVEKNLFDLLFHIESFFPQLYHHPQNTLYLIIFNI